MSTVPAAMEKVCGEAAPHGRPGHRGAAAIHLIPPALTAPRHRRPGADISVVDVPSENGGDEVAARRAHLPPRLADLADGAGVAILAGHAAREQVARSLAAAGYGVARVSRATAWATG